MTYRLSRTGRWNILALIMGTLVVWLFAGWLLADTLGITYAHLATSWRKAYPTWTVGQKVPAFLLLALLIGAPVLLWNLLTEFAARYTVDDDGLHFRSLGLNTQYKWEHIKQIKSGVQITDEPPRIDVLLHETAPRPSVWAHWLHRGHTRRVPIYGNVANRDELLATIKEKMNRER